MVEAKGKLVISNWQKKWKNSNILSLALLALAAAIFLNALFHLVFATSFWWLLPLFLLFGTVFFYFDSSWKIGIADVARFLNTSFPELEESTELALKPTGSLNLLERLQRQKVESILPQLPQPKEFYKRLKVGAIVFAGALAISFLLTKLPFSLQNKHFNPVKEAFDATGKPAKPEAILPEIDHFNLKITPPAYTGKSAREQEKFTISAEDGAMVNWEITTNKAVKQVSFVFNDKEKLPLKAANAEHTLWKTAKAIRAPGFYQVDLDGKMSELYQIEVIKDSPPVIRIQSPNPNSVIDYGEPQKTLLKTALTDDYGISDAYIYATIASGTGEAVKFKEQKIAFAAAFNGHQTQYQLQKLLDLKQLGMQPGDELYFYIKAKDNHNQETRSEVYIVSIADTAKLMQLEGMINSLDLKPELFRSERQIIIETEQLLKDKDTIKVEEFKKRSNNLGFDQKLLRLRYGKFLGEENESGGDPEEGNTLSDPKDFSNATKILDAYTDKHDNAEDATFIDPQTKNQLKATLNEMWSAELRLRTYKPHEALPFAYKALRLLKDLQQKSRAYVAKTSAKIAPLKPAEKRLTGDLTKIIDPVNQQDFKKQTDPYLPLRQSAALLNQLKNGAGLGASSLQILHQSNVQISSKAVSQPSVYLPAVTAFRKILANASQPKNISQEDIWTVEKAIQKMLPPVAKLPAPAQINPDQGLSNTYFQSLTRTIR
ncbi:DUF4175 family protein [Mucilaginibacter arboris]|uniref:DUF4175 family protein n=1 Tax=Mucilaginibacter arboris TaxID=2682090 RepID=A0A7K1SUP7_9SPHI|nr:DUF4175 family protein [Mucilaginibacter arboris]MVN20958.1 DUF4175 family protein [Mucilaginibacter arboris]